MMMAQTATQSVYSRPNNGKRKLKGSHSASYLALMNFREREEHKKQHADRVTNIKMKKQFDQVQKEQQRGKQF